MSLTTSESNFVPEHIDKSKILAAFGIQSNDPIAQAALLVCNRYELDPLLKHVQLIPQKGGQGRQVYVTRDGFLHVAHASGVFDGMETLDERETEGHVIVTVAVYRKDMGRPFKFTGRFKRNGEYQRDDRDPYVMALTRAERGALRRAFDISGVGIAPGDTDEVGPELIEDERPAPSQVTPVIRQEATEPDHKDTEDAKPDPFEQTDEKPAKEPYTQISEEIAPATDEELEALRELVQVLDEEHRDGLKKEWAKAHLGSITPGGERRLRAKDVDRVRQLVEAKRDAQEEIYNQRRKFVLKILKDAGITEDDARHTAIRTATDNEVESSKALLGRHTKQIKDYVDALPREDEDKEGNLL